MHHLELAPSPACPRPGRVLDGDFEVPSPQWTVTGPSSIASGGTVNGTKSLRVATNTVCDFNSAGTGQVSVPLTASMANPALRWRMLGTAGKVLDVQFHAASVTQVTATGAVQALSVCLPDWTFGNAFPLTFTTQVPGGSCATADVRQFDIDDVVLVSDPACAVPLNPYNPGFEQTALDVHWSPYINLGGWPAGSAAFYVRTNASNAHSGNSHIETSSSRICMDTGVRQSIRVPDSVGSNGPAVKLWYRALGTGSSRPTVDVQLHPYGLPVSTVLPAAANWTQAVVCLPSLLRGARATLNVHLHGGYGGCATTYATEYFLFDDVEVGTDATCPP